MYSLKFKNLIIKKLENLKNIYIFINGVCICIINYENYNDFKIDRDKDFLIIYFKNKKVLKYNLKNDYFKLYK